VELEEARHEASVSRAEIECLKEREEKTNEESKKMRERARKQLSEKDEVIKGLRESNATLSSEQLSFLFPRTLADKTPICRGSLKRECSIHLRGQVQD